MLLCACAAVIFFSCPRSFFWASSRGGKIKDLKTPKVSRPPKTSLGLVSWLAHFSARHRQSSRARLKRSADTRKRTLRVLLDLVCSVPSCTYAPSSLVTSPLFISPLHLLSAEDLLQRNSSSLPPLLPFRCFLLHRLWSGSLDHGMGFPFPLASISSCGSLNSWSLELTFPFMPGVFARSVGLWPIQH